MLVKSEYTDVTLDKSTEKKYPLLAKSLTETSVIRKRTMEEEKDNFIVTATDVFINNTDLYGCGVCGIGANDRTGNVYVSNSTIRDCSDGPMNIVDVCGVFEFTNCTLTGSDGFGCFEKKRYLFTHFPQLHFRLLGNIIFHVP